MDLRLARRKTCSTKFQTYIFKNKAALLKKIKKGRFPYLGNWTRYGNFSQFVSPQEVTAKESSAKK